MSGLDVLHGRRGGRSLPSDGRSALTTRYAVVEVTDDLDELDPRWSLVELCISSRIDEGLEPLVVAIVLVHPRDAADLELLDADATLDQARALAWA